MIACHDADKLECLAKGIAHAAMTTLVRLYPEVRNASTEELGTACAAMRAKSREVIDQLMDDAKAAPWIAELALKDAALTMACAGIDALKTKRAG